MEAPHPFLESAVVGIDVVDVKLRRLRLGIARGRQNVERQPGAPREGDDRRSAVAAQLRRPDDHAAQGLGDGGGVETRQDGVDCRTAAVAGNHDRDLLHRQAPLGGFAAPLACGPRKIGAFALEGLQNERLIGLDDPGQMLRLVEIERRQEPMARAEGRGVGHLAAVRRWGDRFAVDQGLRLIVPAVHVAQSSQGCPSQRIERLAAAYAAIAWLAAGLAPGADLIAAAVRTAKAGDPGLPDLPQQTLALGGIDPPFGDNRSACHRALRGGLGHLRSGMVDRIIRFRQSEVLEQQAPLGSVQQSNAGTPNRKRRRVHVRPLFSSASDLPWHNIRRDNSVFNTDQGSQFTCAAFTGLLADNAIAISMDGKGAWRDNVFVERIWRSVKHEEVYLRAYGSVAGARASIGRYLDFYNRKRPHSSLDARTT